MARTSNAKIVSWGEPPMPEPTGWDAIAKELDDNAGKWANIGEYAAATARKITKDRFAYDAGYDSRIVPVKDSTRVTVWVQRMDTDADAPDHGEIGHDVEQRSAQAEALANDAIAAAPRKTVKRGSVV